MVEQYQLSNYDAAVIIDQGIVFADFVEAVARICGDGKQACNWVTQDVLREMNDRKLSIDQFPVQPQVLGEILKRINDKKITIKSGREIFLNLLNSPDVSTISVARVDQIIQEQGLSIVADSGQLEGVIAAVIAKNPKAVADFKGGKQAAAGSLMGQVMREVKGADPATVKELIHKKLTEA